MNKLLNTKDAYINNCLEIMSLRGFVLIMFYVFNATNSFTLNRSCDYIRVHSIGLCLKQAARKWMLKDCMEKLENKYYLT